MDSEYVILLSIIIGLVIFAPASRLLLDICCDVLAPFTRFLVREEEHEDLGHPRRRTRMMQKGYREPTWPTPDMEFETLESI